MKLGYTEFSYGYAFTENLIRNSSAGPTTAPVFPNLIQEAQLGYDVKVDLPGLPYFFQFKLPELMVRDTAREIKIFELPGLAAPFFRMPLMRRDLSNQHAHLIELEKTFPNSVFYTSSKADGPASFNRAYGRAEVHVESVLFSPTDIGPLPDDKTHSVSYATNMSVAWRCSEPKQVKAQKFEAIRNLGSETFTQRTGSSLEDTVHEIRKGVLPLIPQQLRSAEGEFRQRVDARRSTVDGSASIDDRVRTVSTDLLVLREFVRVGLGMDLLIAQPRE
ncbi:hypothetical protein [Hwanghaeella sp. LZ110]|uniref:hypothetical protein n=1 Tax=Hwanghaeella sp. LZ110 TaxID=3402810 RepID=UPI003B67142E